MTELVGPCRSQRRAEVDAPARYRNGHGRLRRLTVGWGTVTLRGPGASCGGAVREPCPAAVRAADRGGKRVAARASPERAYGKCALELALRGLLGEEAPLSASTAAGLKEKWQANMAEWSTWRVDELEVVYLWADWVYGEAGLEDRKAAVLVALAGLTYRRKVVLAFQSGQRESAESWQRFCGTCGAPRVGDRRGSFEYLGGAAQCLPGGRVAAALEPRGVNVLDRIGRRDQPVAPDLLRKATFAEVAVRTGRAPRAFQRCCRQHGYDDA